MRYSSPQNIVRYSNGTLVKLTVSNHQFISYDYDPETDTGTYTPTSIRISAMYAGNLAYSKWQYTKDNGGWVDIPASNDLDITITSTSLVILPSSSLFDKTNSFIMFRLVATDIDTGEEYTDTAEIERIVDYIILYRKQQTDIDQTADKIALIASDEQLRQYGKNNTVVKDLANLKITAGEISSTVSKKVGDDEVITKIRQSPESVKIQASKVDIEGAAIFTSGRLSKNSLNNAYDAKGAASDAVDELTEDLASASGTTVINGGHITTGTIDASKATIKNINAENITAGILQDKSGKNSWDLATGRLVTASGSIGPFELDANGLTNASDYSKFAVRRSLIVSARRATYAAGKSYAASISIDGVRLKFNYQKDSTDIDDIDNLFYFDLQPSTSGFPMLELRTPYSYPDNQMFYMYDPTLTSVEPIQIEQDVRVHNLTVAGTKSRSVNTPDYNDRLLYCYETPTPLFGDIGEAQLDSDGICYVDIDDIFSETIELRQEYQVFLQKEGKGDCWIAEKHPRYFVIKGTPNLKVAWELKAKQKDYDMIRLEQRGRALEEYGYTKDTDLLNDYINEQEELLYG